MPLFQGSVYNDILLNIENGYLTEKGNDFLAGDTFTMVIEVNYFCELIIFNYLFLFNFNLGSSLQQSKIANVRLEGHLLIMKLYNKLFFTKIKF